jgi:hypothetical protein
MSIGRLYRGVVRVVTEEGPYYLRPQMRHRLRLLWMFRHFNELPAVVLKPAELQIISDLAQNSYSPEMQLSDELIGTLDCRAIMKNPSQSESGLRVPNRVDSDVLTRWSSVTAFPPSSLNEKRAASKRGCR